MDAIKNKDVDPIDSNKWSADMSDFVKNCLHRNPEDRWNINQLLGHRIFNNIEECKELWVDNFLQFSARKLRKQRS